MSFNGYSTIPPCKGCTKRFVNTETLETCRTACKEWQEWEEEKQKRYEKNRKEREANRRVSEHFARLAKKLKK